MLLLALCATARAENFSVQATPDNEFRPNQLAVKPGDSVTFSNAGGVHNVVWVEGTFDDGSQAYPAEAAPVWPSDPVRTFNDEGTFRFYCKPHGTPSGAGMAGKVVVSTGSADLTPPALTDLRAGVRRSRPFARFAISEAGSITALLVRSKTGKTLARRTRSVSAGAGRVTFGKRELKPGRYFIALTAADPSGNVAEERRARFRVG